MKNETMEALKKLGFKGISVSKCEIMRGFLKRVENPISELDEMDELETPDVINQFIMLGDVNEYDNQYQEEFEYLKDMEMKDVINALQLHDVYDVFTDEYIDTLYGEYFERITMNNSAFTTEYNVNTNDIIEVGLFYFYHNDTLYITPGSYGVSYNQRLEYLQLLTLKSLSQNSNYVNWRETYDNETCNKIDEILSECDEYITMGGEK